MIDGVHYIKITGSNNEESLTQQQYCELIATALSEEFGKNFEVKEDNGYYFVPLFDMAGEVFVSEGTYITVNPSSATKNYLKVGYFNSYGHYDSDMTFCFWASKGSSSGDKNSSIYFSSTQGFSLLIDTRFMNTSKIYPITMIPTLDDYGTIFVDYCWFVAEMEDKDNNLKYIFALLGAYNGDTSSLNMGYISDEMGSVPCYNNINFGGFSSNDNQNILLHKICTKKLTLKGDAFLIHTGYCKTLKEYIQGYSAVFDTNDLMKDGLIYNNKEYKLTRKCWSSSFSCHILALKE